MSCVILLISVLLQRLFPQSLVFPFGSWNLGAGWAGAVLSCHLWFSLHVSTSQVSVLKTSIELRQFYMSGCLHSVCSRLVSQPGAVVWSLVFAGKEY